jgi:hypothetical protein
MNTTETAVQVAIFHANRTLVELSAAMVKRDNGYPDTAERKAMDRLLEDFDTFTDMIGD